jgi:tRNA 2-thiouridine synthesizing protein E
MPQITFKGKTYDVDANGFLLSREQWDEDFARALAPAAQIPHGLTEAHWRIIHYIRDHLSREQICPLVYETCKANRIFLRQLKELFPTGYLRGACKLAGLSYRDRFINYFGEEGDLAFRPGLAGPARPEKAYLTNAAGFLVDPAQWDEMWAVNKAAELGIKPGLTSTHWKIIRYLREYFERAGKVPTVFETCEANGLELEALEKLFPPGYQRGAVKVAGLWVA